MAYLENKWKWTKRLDKYYLRELKGLYHTCSGEKWQTAEMQHQGFWSWKGGVIRTGVNFHLREWNCYFPKAQVGNPRHSHTHTESNPKARMTMLSKFKFMGFFVKLVSPSSFSGVFFFQKWQIWNVVMVKAKYSCHSSAKNTYKWHHTPHTAPKPDNSTPCINVISNKWFLLFPIVA